MGWNRYLICIFIFPREGNSVRRFTVTSNGIFYYFSCFGEADSTMNLLSVFSSSTQIVFLSLFFCICLLSAFPCPDFPAAKPWDLLSGSLYLNPTSSHGTFPPSLSLPGKARCCKCRLKTPRSLQPFEKGKKHQLKLKPRPSPLAAQRRRDLSGCTKHVVLLLSGTARFRIGTASVYTVC